MQQIRHCLMQPSRKKRWYDDNLPCLCVQSSAIYRAWVEADCPSVWPLFEKCRLCQVVRKWVRFSPVKVERMKIMRRGSWEVVVVWLIVVCWVGGHPRHTEGKNLYFICSYRAIQRYNSVLSAYQSAGTKGAKNLVLCVRAILTWVLYLLRQHQCRRNWDKDNILVVNQLLTLWRVTILCTWYRSFLWTPFKLCWASCSCFCSLSLPLLYTVFSCPT